MEEKIKIEVYRGVEIIKEMIKNGYWCQTMGKSAFWITAKLSHVEVYEYAQKFLPEHVALMNEAIWKIGEELSDFRLEFTDDKAEMAARIKTLAKIVCMPYIYGNVMNKPKDWFVKRTAKSESYNRYRFKPDDILQMNLAIVAIANKLKSIELYLDEVKNID